MLSSDTWKRRSLSPHPGSWAPTGMDEKILSELPGRPCLGQEVDGDAPSPALLA